MKAEVHKPEIPVTIEISMTLQELKLLTTLAGKTNTTHNRRFAEERYKGSEEAFDDLMVSLFNLKDKALGELE